MLCSKGVWRAKFSWATSLLRRKHWWLRSMLVSVTSQQEQWSSLLICNEKGSRHPSEECNIPPIRVDSCSSVHQGQFSPVARIRLQKRKEVLWTDSQVVLGYIRNDARRFHLFVAILCALLKSSGQQLDDECARQRRWSIVQHWLQIYWWCRLHQNHSHRIIYWQWKQTFSCYHREISSVLTYALARDGAEFNTCWTNFGNIGRRASFSPCKNVRKGLVPVPTSKPMILFCSRTIAFCAIIGSSLALLKLNQTQMVWYERWKSLWLTVASRLPVCWNSQSRSWFYLLHVSPVREPGIPPGEPTISTRWDIILRLWLDIDSWIV